MRQSKLVVGSWAWAWAAACVLALACSSEGAGEHDNSSSGGTTVGSSAGQGSAGSGTSGSATSNATGGGADLAKGGNSDAGTAATTAGSAGAPGGSPGMGGSAGSAAGSAAAGAGTGGATSACDNSLAASNKTQANAALDALFVDKQTSAIAQYWAEPYLQHNPIAKSGVAAFTSAMSGVVASASFTYERLRSLAECDLVVVQGRYSGTGVIFDMFRMKGGKLVEHWDSDSNQASSADGPTEISNTEPTAANRALVLAYLQDGGDHLAAGYVEHRAASTAKISYVKVHHVIADGNFVFALTEGTLDGKPYGFYDLFRLTDGKLAEHWDSRRAVPASTASGLAIF